MLLNLIKYSVIISILTFASHIICLELNPELTTALSSSPSSPVLIVGNINHLPAREIPLSSVSSAIATAEGTTSGQLYTLDNNDNTIIGTSPLIIQPYNIFDSIVLCPVGYILAHNHCHKQVKTIKYYMNI